MRNMSFALTTQQVRSRAKTVTRRMGWLNLKIGELICAVVKCQGLKKGEKIEKLTTIRIVHVQREYLNSLLFDPDRGLMECAKEGFDSSHPMGNPKGFIRGFVASHKGCKPDSLITRIEFEYI